MKKMLPFIALTILLTMKTTYADLGDYYQDDYDWSSRSYHDYYDDNNSFEYQDDSLEEDDSDILSAIEFLLIGGGIVGVSVFNLVSPSNKNKKERNPNAPNELPKNMPNYDGDIISDAEEYGIAYQIMQEDENFNLERFLTYSKIVFRSLQTAWTKKNLELIRLYENDDLFELHSNQIKFYIENHQRNVVDMIQIRNAEVYSLKEEGGKNVLGVILTCSLLDYIVNEKTNKVIYGSRDKRINRMYLMTFSRKKGVKTKPQVKDTTEVECPNCGAHVIVTSKGECRYCGTLIRTDEYDWILSNIEPFRK